MRQRENYPVYTVPHIEEILKALYNGGKESIHCSFKTKEEIEFQLLITFRHIEDPSVLIAEGNYLENGTRWERIAHKQSDWIQYLEKCLLKKEIIDTTTQSFKGHLINLQIKSVTTMPVENDATFIYQNGYMTAITSSKND